MDMAKNYFTVKHFELQIKFQNQNVTLLFCNKTAAIEIPVQSLKFRIKLRIFLYLSIP